MLRPSSYVVLTLSFSGLVCWYWQSGWQSGWASAGTGELRIDVVRVRVSKVRLEPYLGNPKPIKKQKKTNKLTTKLLHKIRTQDYTNKSNRVKDKSKYYV